MSVTQEKQLKRKTIATVQVHPEKLMQKNSKYQIFVLKVYYLV